jgi:hypothetical protein
MSRAPTDPEKLAAAIEQLEAEQRRREDERIAAGSAVRVPLNAVVHPGEDEAEAIARAKSTAHAQADGREILFEEPELIFTGVPRSDQFGKWQHQHFEPEYPTRYATTPTIRPRKGDDHHGVPSEPATTEWKSIRIQVAAPNEATGDPGKIIEAEYVAVGNQVRVRYDGRGYVETFRLGDDPLVIARRLLRTKWDKHGAFYDPIAYPKLYH